MDLCLNAHAGKIFVDIVTMNAQTALVYQAAGVSDLLTAEVVERLRAEITEQAIAQCQMQDGLVISHCKVSLAQCKGDSHALLLKGGASEVHLLG